MRAELGLPSVKGDDELGGGMTGGFGGSMGGIAGQGGKGKRPINVKFEIPYFTTSGIQVRYLKIIEPKVSARFSLLLPAPPLLQLCFSSVAFTLGVRGRDPFQPPLCNGTLIGCGRLSTSDEVGRSPHGWHDCVWVACISICLDSRYAPARRRRSRLMHFPPFRAGSCLFLYKRVRGLC